ncbi:MAG: metal ABC transporter ATP-binding protein [Saezia sp.]
MTKKTSANRPESTGIIFEHTTLAYRHKIVQKDIQGHIHAGSMVAIVGVNGSGKSTLMKAMAGLMRPAGGDIHNYFKKEKIAYLSQLNSIDSTFPITVFDFVACGLWAQIGAFKAIQKTEMETILSALDAVGMRAYEDTLIGELSGGQLQRIRFARLALQDAELFLLDEPFAAVDEHTVTDLMCLLHYWHEQGKTVVVVLHDMELVRKQFPEIIVLGEHKKIIGWGNTEQYYSLYHTSPTLLNTEYQHPMPSSTQTQEAH